jgi:hypothetical protein
MIQKIFKEQKYFYCVFEKGAFGSTGEDNRIENTTDEFSSGMNRVKEG